MSASMTATLKYALTSDKKMLLLAKLVQWKNAEESLRILEFTQKKAAGILHKVVKSAFSNAVASWSAPESLYINTIHVGRWPKLKRMRFASRSKVHRYVKHRSYVKVILENK